MTSTETKPTSPPPPRPFQFTLRTLLLLFVVLASSMAVFGGWAIFVFVLVVGLAVFLHALRSWRWWAGFGLFLLCLEYINELLVPGPYPGRHRFCGTELREIAAALQVYHQRNGCFPPAYIADKDGKPMHSWRVLLTPYLDREEILKAWDFTQPWDGPKNQKLLTGGPDCFSCVGERRPRVNGTPRVSYLAVVGSHAAWAGEKPRKLDDIRSAGKLGDTVLLIEVPNSDISLAQPKDVSLDADQAGNVALPALPASSNHGHPGNDFFFIREYGSGVYAAMADGSVRILRTDGLSTADLRKLLEIGGCKTGQTVIDGSTGEYTRRLNWPNIAALAVWLLSVGTLLIGAVRGRKIMSVSPPPS